MILQPWHKVSCSPSGPRPGCVAACKWPRTSDPPLYLRGARIGAQVSTPSLSSSGMNPRAFCSLTPYWTHPTPTPTSPSKDLFLHKVPLLLKLYVFLVCGGVSSKMGVWLFFSILEISKPRDQYHWSLSEDLLIWNMEQMISMRCSEETFLLGLEFFLLLRTEHWI